MKYDLKHLAKPDFLEKYGHLRPGTYDILSPRYDEKPDFYFDWENEPHVEEQKESVSFSLTIQQLRKIQEYIDKDGLQVNVLELLEFIKLAIESREHSKFIFSRSVSEFLKIFTAFCLEHGISREDSAFINFSAIRSLYTSSIEPEEFLTNSLELGKKNHVITSTITLPPLIVHPSQIWGFELSETSPNFITQRAATGEVVVGEIQKQSIMNAILMISNADPGYDWIFSHEIAGFITQYGGVNSHMAIRAAELGIPAVIGVGEVKFNLWSKAKKLHIDCLNRQVQQI
ncbi:MAG: hypothetical protein K0U24_07135 [Gammaproteobacteria bacterium]|nr:hypothetical protein [Gammaproteobacteria bacterium]